MTVNQLRGRSIRLDPDEPNKLANNWDVVCIAPEFSKGLDDYARFIKKHKTIFGVTDDGAVEKGVGHVHAAFTELKPEGLEGSVAALNAGNADAVVISQGHKGIGDKPGIRAARIVVGKIVGNPGKDRKRLAVVFVYIL